MYTFFYGYKDLDTYFLSQFYPCVFYDKYKNKFCCAEQYMMWSKAMLFKDYQVAERILGTTNPKTIKSLGRSVKDFNEKIWNEHKVKIVSKGNWYKFTQNKYLLERLLKTEGELVEASPFDRIWGIGYDKDNALRNSDNWGENLLGQILTKLRDDIKMK